MTKKRKSDYVPAPTVEDEMARRYEAVLSVLGGASTVTQAAERLGMSRNRFQTLMHRGLTALVNELVPKPPGPTPMSETERQAREENEQLRRRVQRLEAQVQTADRMLGMASEMMRGRVKMTGRMREPKTARTTTNESEAATPSPRPDPDAEDPDVAVASVRELRRLGMRAECAAALAGRSASTLRRWTKRARDGERLRSRPGPAPRPPLDTQTRARVDELVRATHGLIGADALRHAVPGASRRQCGGAKSETVTAMERERRDACGRVVVTSPGVVRGFDQMHLRTTRGRQVLLFSADGAVAYRTSVALAEHYDAASVASAVKRDFAANGPPLVWRADRAKSHDAPEVRAVLDADKVLLLHGPPRHPQYYAQLERQNREHRAWLDDVGVLEPAALAEEAERMLETLNGAWPRRTLGWKTASAAWRDRSPVEVDRDELREEVRERASRLQRESGLSHDQAERFAIEAALTQRGLLHWSVGGWR